MSASPGPSEGEEASLPDLQTVRDVLRKVGFLSHLRMGELEILLKHMRKMPVVRNTVIIRQDDTDARTFYILMRGRCSVWIRQGEAEHKVDLLGPGSFFGERALITDEPRAATVKAEEFSELYVLSKEDFESALMGNPQIAESMELKIARYRREPLDEG